MKNLILITLMCFAFNAIAETKLCWVKVTPEFKEEYDGYRKGVNVLKTATDTSGNIVVSCNALNEFPELFDTMDVNIIWLSPQAFPQEEIYD